MPLWISMAQTLKSILRLVLQKNTKAYQLTRRRFNFELGLLQMCRTKLFYMCCTFVPCFESNLFLQNGKWIPGQQSAMSIILCLHVSILVIQLTWNMSSSVNCEWVSLYQVSEAHSDTSFALATVARARHDDSTSNLRRHRNSCTAVPNAQASGQLTMPMFAAGSTYSEAKLRLLIVKWCACNSRPMLIVQDEAYVEQLKMFNQGVVIPSDTISWHQAYLHYCQSACQGVSCSDSGKEAPMHGWLVFTQCAVHSW